MVAYNHNDGNSVNIYSGYSSIRDAVSLAVAEYGRAVSPAPGGPSCCSDHEPFEDAGFEACLLIEDYWANPHYHQPSDSVDTPDYIDYEYATNNTRAVVGYLVDNAGVNVDIPDGDYDADGDVDSDDYDVFVGCFTGPGGPPAASACDFFDLDTDGDVDCADWDLLSAVWTGPPEDPPVFWPCNPLPPTVEGSGGRCLSVTPPGDGVPTALLVTGDPGDAAVSCISLYAQTDGRLGATPVYQTAWGTAFVCDEEILPASSYTVQCAYGDPDSPILSPGGVATTAIWGDTVGDFVGGEWTPANGIVNFNDISAVVDKFKDLPTAPPIHAVDLLGPNGAECSPDMTIDFLDIGAAVDAFVGRSYLESSLCPNVCD
jgi:hypothetical protein